MNLFWKSDVYTVIKAMKASGNEPGLVARWLGQVAQWVALETGPDGAALRAWLPLWQARPFYSANELAPMFPALILALGLRERLPPAMSPERLAFQLDYGRLPTLRNVDGTDRFVSPQGYATRYYTVERIGYWSKQILTQKEFEDVLHDG